MSKYLSHIALAHIVSSQMNMDYAICKSLTYHSEGMTDHCIMYDIACQWSRNFFKRLQESPYLNVPPNMTLQSAIGIFHVHGHQRMCFARYAPNFVQGLGVVDGEVMETVWSNMNHIAESTRTMTKANRQETIDDHMSYHNWKKLIKLGELHLCALLAGTN